MTRLVAAGLLLAKTSTKDRRLNILALSRRGRSGYQKIVPIALEHEAPLVALLSPAEHLGLMQSLDTLHKGRSRLCRRC